MSNDEDDKQSVKNKNDWGTLNGSDKEGDEEGDSVEEGEVEWNAFSIEAVRLVVTLNYAEAISLKKFLKLARVDTYERHITNEKAHAIFGASKKIIKAITECLPPDEMLRDLLRNGWDGNVELLVGLSKFEASSLDNYLRKASIDDFEEVFHNKKYSERMTKAAWAVIGYLKWLNTNLDMPPEWRVE